jgi:putative acetyltransferase
MTIRPAISADQAAIDTLLESAFGGRDEVELVRALRKDGDIAYELVCTSGADVTGHIVFSPLDGPLRCLALAPLSVLPQKQGHGIGTMLVKQGLEAARQQDWQAVFVLGDPGYYQRFGFSVDRAKAFQSPYAGGYFGALELDENSLANKAGRLRHAAAFSALEG